MEVSGHPSSLGDALKALGCPKFFFGVAICAILVISNDELYFAISFHPTSFYLSAMSNC